MLGENGCAGLFLICTKCSSKLPRANTDDNSVACSLQRKKERKTVFFVTTIMAELSQRLYKMAGNISHVHTVYVHI